MCVTAGLLTFVKSELHCHPLVQDTSFGDLVGLAHFCLCGLLQDHIVKVNGLNAFNESVESLFNEFIAFLKVLPQVSPNALVLYVRHIRERFDARLKLRDSKRCARVISGDLTVLSLKVFKALTQELLV